MFKKISTLAVSLFILGSAIEAQAQGAPAAHTNELNNRYTCAFNRPVDGFKYGPADAVTLFANSTLEAREAAVAWFGIGRINLDAIDCQLLI